MESAFTLNPNRSPSHREPSVGSAGGPIEPNADPAVTVAGTEGTDAADRDDQVADTLGDRADHDQTSGEPRLGITAERQP
jgi:hypothetical protein